jgi:NADPH2:quinone reductase
VDEVGEPVPGRGEVLVAVRAAGVNFPDVLLARGKYQFQPELPFSPGGELAGEVIAVGDGVSRLASGDRVAATMIHGAFAERVVVPEDACAKLPPEVDDVTAAGFLVTYGTAYHALVERAALASGETLLVLGAAGGVGLAAVEVGKLLGARVLAAASSPDKLALCRDRGAEAGIDYGRENLKERAKALSGGGVDVVFDPVGGEHSEAALRALAWSGRLLVVGFASGTIPKIPLNLVLLKSCQIVGVFWGMAARRDPEGNRRSVDRLLGWLAEGALRPHIDARLPLERGAEAIERLERREARGKLVVTMG